MTIKASFQLMMLGTRLNTKRNEFIDNFTAYLVSGNITMLVPLPSSATVIN